MAKGKLKSALLSHQIQAERLKNEQRAKERREAIAAVTEARKGRGRGKGKLVGPAGPVPGAKRAKVINGTGDNHGKVDSIKPTDGELDPHGAVPTETRTKSPRRTIPFARDDTILLLGEANFSFSHSLLQPPHSHPAHQICATSYDSETVCYEKYPDAKGLVEDLRRLGVKVGFGVDAGELGKSWKVVGKGKRWSRVIFNFPHVGAGIKDQDRNILSNQHLLLRTLRSVHPLLTRGPSASRHAAPGQSKKRKRPAREKGTDSYVSDGDGDDSEDEDHSPALGEGVYAVNSENVDLESKRRLEGEFNPPTRQGSILITLLNQAPYSLWGVKSLATRPPPLCPGTTAPQPKYTLVRSFEFHPDVYEGYAHRRTLGFKAGVSKASNEEITGRKGSARTWEFEPVEEKAVEKAKKLTMGGWEA